MLSDYGGLVEKKKLGNLLYCKNYMYIRTPLPNNQTWFMYTSFCPFPFSPSILFFESVYNFIYKPFE